MTMCPGCGSPLGAGETFCARCEAKIASGAPQVPAGSRPAGGDDTAVAARTPPPADVTIASAAPPVEATVASARPPADATLAAPSVAAGAPVADPTEPVLRVTRTTTVTETEGLPDPAAELPLWPDPDDDDGRPAWIGPAVIGFVAALLAFVGIVLLLNRNNDDRSPNPDVVAPSTTLPSTSTPSSGAPTLPTTPVSTAPPTTLPPTTPPATAAPTAAPPATTAPTTVPSTQPPATTAAPAPTPAPTAAPTPPPTTTTLPPTPTTTPDSSPPQEVVDTAQSLATALANGDWDTARQLNPDLEGWSDERFEENYGDLERSTVIPISSSQTGNGHHDLRLGLVAHQIVDGGQRTTVYCATYRVNSEAGTVEPQGRATELFSEPVWLDPPSLTDRIKRDC